MNVALKTARGERRLARPRDPRRASAPGLGLGLATVRRLVEAHGGQAGVEPGEPGSRFWFELPRLEGSAAS